MNWFQRRFFARRERELRLWERRRMLDERVAVERVAGMPADDFEAVLRILQRVIDGRCAILARAGELPEAVYREVRGAMMGLEDFSEALVALRRGAGEEEV